MIPATERCPDCGASPGEFHQPACDVEQCPYCGGQLLSCDCRRRPPLDDRMPWTGVWPGVAECRKFGWFAKLVHIIEQAHGASGRGEQESFGQKLPRQPPACGSERGANGELGSPRDTPRDVNSGIWQNVVRVSP